MSAFKAKYRGRCAACDGGIQEGDLVLYVDDDLVHEDCEGAALVDAKALDICEVCFIARPCECDDERKAG